MKDYISLGSSPLDEDCAQVGSPDYYERSHVELRELKRMMNKIYPPVMGSWYTIKAFPHDFGSYYELCACYDDEIDLAVDWAMKADDMIPDEWDKEAALILQS